MLRTIRPPHGDGAREAAHTGLTKTRGPSTATRCRTSCIGRFPARSAPTEHLRSSGRRFPARCAHAERLRSSGNGQLFGRCPARPKSVNRCRAISVPRCRAVSVARCRTASAARCSTVSVARCNAVLCALFLGAELAPQGPPKGT